MPGPFSGRVLPDNQRKSLSELAGQLDLSSGDRASKQSAFWTMLALSAVIATAGVLADSTATVIGAMIIAPLATPIMGLGLAVATADTGLLRRSAAFVAAGALLVIGVGALIGLLSPDAITLATNGQVTGRTSPRLVDMLAAVATGFAGAVGLARRDVADIMPGVAIAISLVPPLAVVGICLEHGSFAFAAGALLLFLSNLVALVLAGTVIFTSYGYAREARVGEEVTPRRAYTVIGVGLVLVLVPLAANSLGNILVARWTEAARTVAQEWVAAEPGASVERVDVQSHTLVVSVRTPSDVPPVSDLLASLQGEVPDGLRVVVLSSQGNRLEAGSVGS